MPRNLDANSKDVLISQLIFAGGRHDHSASCTKNIWCVESLERENLIRQRQECREELIMI